MFRVAYLKEENVGCYEHGNEQGQPAFRRVFKVAARLSDFVIDSILASLSFPCNFCDDKRTKTCLGAPYFVCFCALPYAFLTEKRAKNVQL